MYAKHNTLNYHIEADSLFIEQLANFSAAALDGVALKRYATETYEFNGELNGYTLLQPYANHANNNLPDIPANTNEPGNLYFFDLTDSSWKPFIIN